MSNVVNEERTTIKEMRKELGLNMSQVADDLNITRQTLSDWEESLDCVTVRHLRVLCDYFGCSPNDIVY